MVKGGHELGFLVHHMHQGMGYCQLNLKEAELKQDSPQFANSVSV